jgi:hypothetical protein
MSGFVRTTPDGDDRARLTCQDCGYVAYENPKIVVGSVVEVAGQILLCRRAIEPRRGFWTLPAGYMEMAETVGKAPGARPGRKPRRGSRWRACSPSIPSPGWGRCR